MGYSDQPSPQLFQWSDVVTIRLTHASGVGTTVLPAEPPSVPVWWCMQVRSDIRPPRCKTAARICCDQLELGCMGSQQGVCLILSYFMCIPGVWWIKYYLVQHSDPFWAVSAARDWRMLQHGDELMFFITSTEDKEAYRNGLILWQQFNSFLLNTTISTNGKSVWGR